LERWLGRMPGRGHCSDAVSDGCSVAAVAPIESKPAPPPMRRDRWGRSTAGRRPQRSCRSCGTNGHDLAHACWKSLRTPFRPLPYSRPIGTVWILAVPVSVASFTPVPCAGNAGACPQTPSCSTAGICIGRAPAMPGRRRRTRLHRPPTHEAARCPPNAADRAR
jgi:hypothetical protein